MASILSRTSPSDEQLVVVLRTLRAQFPTLGIIKFHALLLNNHPSWTVSEKRFRKVLQQQGLNSVRATQNSEDAPDVGEEGKVYPTSRINEHLDVESWTKKVEVAYFGPKKGKGLVAKEKIEKGERVWKEDPWIIAPEWEIYNAQEMSLACMHCTTPLSDSRLIVPCSASCPARFCNRLCLAKSAFIHPLLCRVQNPSAGPLLDFAKRGQWIGLHALAQQTSKLLLANEKGDGERDAQWRIIRGFAEMGMEDRVRENGQTTATRDRMAWKSAHKLYVQAFRSPIDPNHQKKLSRLIKRSLPNDIESELFSYNSFLRGLGRMNLNLEAHGGLYILHSHLNHTCNPNLSIRHFDQRSALGRITVVALDDIEPGNELLITYVDPNAGVRDRRLQLREWGFGECKCARCVKEVADLPPEELETSRRDGNAEEGAEEGAGSNDAPKIDHADLERELREGLGL